MKEDELKKIFKIAKSAISSALRDEISHRCEIPSTWATASTP